MARSVFQFLSMHLWNTLPVKVRTLASAAVLVVVVASLLNATYPLFLKQAVDALDVYALRSDSRASASIVTPLVLFCATMIGARLLEELRWILYGPYEQKVLSSIRYSVLEHLLHLPYTFHLKRRLGEIDESAQNALFGTRQLIYDLCFSIAPLTLEVLFATVVLSYTIGADFAAFFLLSLVLYVVVTYFGTELVVRAQRGTIKSLTQTRGLSTDILLNYETAKLQCAEAALLERYYRQLLTNEERFRTLFNKRVLSGLMQTVAVLVALGGTLFLAVTKIRGSAFSAGDFVLVITYLLNVLRPLSAFSAVYRESRRSVEFLRGIVATMQLQREPPAGRLFGAAPCSVDFGADIVLRSVSFTYEDGGAGLHEIGVRLPGGKVTAIIGSTGSGKSTLWKLLYRFLTPTSGSIAIDGTNIQDVSLQVLRENVAVVSQNVSLFNMPVKDNLLLGTSDASVEAITTLLKWIRLTHLLDDTGLERASGVGETGTMLSGGEKQRLALVRALLKRPRILVLDEATAALDPETELTVLQQLRQQSGACTILMVTHRVRNTEFADYVAVIEDGRLVEAGAPHALLSANGRYASLYADATRSAAEPNDLVASNA